MINIKKLKPMMYHFAITSKKQSIIHMSSCFKSSVSLFSVFFFIIFNTVSSATDPTYLFHICPNTTTFTRNSTYLTNLRTVLSSLSSPNAAYASRFDNATAGDDNNRVSAFSSAAETSQPKSAVIASRSRPTKRSKGVQERRRQ